MKVKDLIAELQALPQDFSIELTKVLALANSTGFEVTLDAPIMGIGVHQEDREVRLIIEAGAHLMGLGKVRKFPPPARKRETGDDDIPGLITRERLTMFRETAATLSEEAQELLVHQDLVSRAGSKLAAALDDCLREAADKGVDRRDIESWRKILDQADEVLIEAYPDKEPPLELDDDTTVKG